MLKYTFKTADSLEHIKAAGIPANVLTYNDIENLFKNSN